MTKPKTILSEGPNRPNKGFFRTGTYQDLSY
jgi:hypothetical protein